MEPKKNRWSSGEMAEVSAPDIDITQEQFDKLPRESDAPKGPWWWTRLRGNRRGDQPERKSKEPDILISEEARTITSRARGRVREFLQDEKSRSLTTSISVQRLADIMFEFFVSGEYGKILFMKFNRKDANDRAAISVDAYAKDFPIFDPELLTVSSNAPRMVEEFIEEKIGWGNLPKYLKKMNIDPNVAADVDAFREDLTAFVQRELVNEYTKVYEFVTKKYPSLPIKKLDDVQKPAAVTTHQ